MSNYENSAYPIVRDTAAGDAQVLAPGMTKREAFAGMILAALVTGTMTTVSNKVLSTGLSVNESTDVRLAPELVKSAVGIADALLDALERKTDNH